jgi:hypothetical protein
MCYFEGDKSGKCIYKRVVVNKKIYAFNRNQMQDANNIEEMQKLHKRR